jgi:hypothetical protein
MTNYLIQGLSLVGAGLILIAYAGHHYGNLRTDSLRYGFLNLFGSLALALTAIKPLDSGVLVVESAWAVISVSVLIRILWRHKSPFHSGTGTD